jgi:hypothetical protein
MALAPQFAKELAEDLAKAKHPVTAEVALAAAVAHLMEGKEASMKVLVAAGVPMTQKQKKYGLAACSWFEVNGHTIFIG